MYIAVTLVTAYLLGSVLPAEWFARARGIDIRAVGTRNPGTTNALQELGFVPGLVTGAYDASVGLVSMYLAYRSGLGAGWMYVAGLFAVLGHCFPLFSRFRGGQGMAATTAMLLYAMAVALGRGWLTANGIALLAVLAILVFALTRSATDVGVVVAPLLVLELLVGRPEWLFGTFAVALATHIWLTQLWIARANHLFRLVAPVRDRLAKMHAPTH